MIRVVVGGFLGSLIVAGCASAIWQTDPLWSVGSLAVAIVAGMLLAWVVEE